jgi:hypothetical protein
MKRLTVFLLQARLAMLMKAQRARLVVLRTPGFGAEAAYARPWIGEGCSYYGLNVGSRGLAYLVVREGWRERQGLRER